MFIKSQYIYLRALESSDLELLYSEENNIKVWSVSNLNSPLSRDVLELYLQAAHQDIYTNKQLRLMICLNKNHTPIGTIDLFEFDPMHLRVGVGVLIFEDFRMNGYAFESIELVKQYAKDILFMNQLYCNISETNLESIALFEKCQFNKIGVKKQWNQIAKQQFEDEIMFQLLF